MRKLPFAALALAAAFAMTACSEPGPTEDEPSADATTAETETEATEAEQPEPAALGACDEDPVASALSDLVSKAGVEPTPSEPDDMLLVNCTWGNGDDLGPQVYLTVTESDIAIDETVLEELGQERLEDSRFASIGAYPTIVIGCDDGTAAGAFGCAIAVYGDGADLTLQALSADSVTLEDLMDAAWNLSETLYA